MSRITECSITRPVDPVDPDEAFDLGVELELVNNALLCQCVVVEVALIPPGGTRTVIDRLTVEVYPGGADNPARVRLETPITPAVMNPALAVDAETAVDRTIVSDEVGCGLFSCEEGAENGAIVRLEG